MARTVILTPEAQSDIRDAYHWYENKLPGLGEQFLECLESGLNQIAQFPRHFPVRFDDFRRILIRRFPYAIYFDFDDDAVVIYYVFHGAQNPEMLAKRLQK